MTIVTLVLLVIFLALVSRYPPIAVFALAMTSISGDGFGLNNYLRVIGLETFAIGINGPVAIASLVCCYRILTDRKGEFGLRAKFSVWVILALATWIPISVLARGGSLSFALGHLMYNGILVAPIVVAYARKPVARIFFVVLILTQLTLATLIILEPSSPVGGLQGINYKTGLGDLSHISQEFKGQISRTSDQARMFAQFIDPDTYGLYSVAGLALGSFLLLRARTFSRRAVGIAVISVAVFGWITTFSRGATIGLLIGVLLVIGGRVASRRTAKGGILATAVVALAGLVLAAMNLDLVGSSAGALSAVSFSAADVNGRLDAVRVGLQESTGNTSFGVPLDFMWPHNVAPHQVPFYFAAEYGILPGFLVCLLLWAVLGSTRRFLLSSIPLAAQWDIALAVIIGWILLGTAATNNLSAPILFWVLWAIAAAPWLNEPRRATHGVSMRKHVVRLDLRGGCRFSAHVPRSVG